MADPHWQQVEIFDIHPFPSPAGFSLHGYAGGPANSYVFGASVILKGSCPLRSAADPGHPLEYRFLIGEWGWPDGADDPGAVPSVAPAALAPVTQLATTHVGYVFYTNGPGQPDSEKVLVGPADLRPDSWIRIDGKAVSVSMRDGTTAVVNVDSANFLPTYDLFVLNSPAITGQHAAKLPIAEAGRGPAPAEREPIRRYRLMFEVRDGSTLATVAGETLDSIVLDNSSVALALELEELRASACAAVTGGTAHIRYTIDHPHLRLYRLAVSNNGGVAHPPPPLPAASFIAPPPLDNLLFRGAASTLALDVSDDAACAYRVALTWQTRHYLASAQSAERLYAR